MKKYRFRIRCEGGIGFERIVETDNPRAELQRLIKRYRDLGFDVVDAEYIPITMKFISISGKKK